jgi:hypothetical protein
MWAGRQIDGLLPVPALSIGGGDESEASGVQLAYENDRLDHAVAADALFQPLEDVLGQAARVVVGRAQVLQRVRLVERCPGGHCSCVLVLQVLVALVSVPVLVCFVGGLALAGLGLDDGGRGFSGLGVCLRVPNWPLIRGATRAVAPSLRSPGWCSPGW